MTLRLSFVVLLHAHLAHASEKRTERRVWQSRELVQKENMQASRHRPTSLSAAAAVYSFTTLDRRSLTYARTQLHGAEVEGGRRTENPVAGRQCAACALNPKLANWSTGRQTG